MLYYTHIQSQHQKQLHSKNTISPTSAQTLQSMKEHQPQSEIEYFQTLTLPAPTATYLLTLESQNIKMKQKLETLQTSTIKYLSLQGVKYAKQVLELESERDHLLEDMAKMQKRVQELEALVVEERKKFIVLEEQEEEQEQEKENADMRRFGKDGFRDGVDMGRGSQYHVLESILKEISKSNPNPDQLTRNKSKQEPTIQELEEQIEKYLIYFVYKFAVGVTEVQNKVEAKMQEKVEGDIKMQEVKEVKEVEEKKEVKEVEEKKEVKEVEEKKEKKEDKEDLKQQNDRKQNEKMREKRPEPSRIPTQPSPQTLHLMQQTLQKQKQKLIQYIQDFKVVMEEKEQEKGQDKGKEEKVKDVNNWSYFQMFANWFKWK